MPIGTFKSSSGDVLNPRTISDAISISVENESYSLTDVINVLMNDPTEVISESRDSIISAGNSYTVPEYVVGTSNLSVYYDGLKLIEGSNGTYTEVGTENSTSTTIQFNDDIATDVQLIFRVSR